MPKISWVAEAFNIDQRPYLATIERKGKYVSIDIISRIHERRGADEPDGKESWHLSIAVFQDDLPEGTLLKSRQPGGKKKVKAIIAYYLVTSLGLKRVPFKKVMRLAAMDVGMRERQVIPELRLDHA
ncbi:MAG: hypothetical protein JRN68_03435 [Nitrososphaerota archaeon]|nr:hypothetical protein [Ferrimicrobium acidiphilum]MDG6933729.1 hypothetical protein [Nitrososphaerota archaeon]